MKGLKDTQAGFCPPMLLKATEKSIFYIFAESCLYYFHCFNYFFKPEVFFKETTLGLDYIQNDAVFWLELMSR